MPKFLSTSEIYRILQRELPEDAYADGSPSGFYTTADMWSIADAACTGYSNLQRIWANMFPQTSVEQIDKWEMKVFGVPQDSSLSITQRQNLVIAKLRERRNLSLYSILTAILDYLPDGTPVQLWQWCHILGEGQWSLGVSRLNKDTWLGGMTKFAQDGYNYCNPALDNSWRLGRDKLNLTTKLGLDPDYSFTKETWFEQQKQAFAYTVRVFGYTMTATEKAAIHARLSAIEPARSYHYFLDGLSLTDFGLNYQVSNVDSTTTLDCLYKDTLSTTGYSAYSVNP